MLNALRAEFRKLLTVRSTYIITAVVIALSCLIGFYLIGWQTPAGPALFDRSFISSNILGALNLLVFGAIVAILLVTHEYRYNTIVYTLTTSNSRNKVLLAKILAVSVYAIFLTILVALVTPAMIRLGIMAHGNTLGPQVIDYGNIIWRSLFYGWAYGMIGLLFAILIRSQVGAIAALFLLPSLVEQLLSLWLKKNTAYLPFTSLANVINGAQHGIAPGEHSPAKSAVTVMIYLVIGWIVAWILFVRRDAN